MTDEALVERLAGVMAEHAYVPSALRGVSRCGCGVQQMHGMPHDHRVHVAAELAAVVGEVEAAAASRALTEAVDEIEAELVCCDVFERLRDKRAIDHTQEQKVERRMHSICYWGEAAATLVRDRAERTA